MVCEAGRRGLIMYRIYTPVVELLASTVAATLPARKLHEIMGVVKCYLRLGLVNHTCASAEQCNLGRGPLVDALSFRWQHLQDSAAIDEDCNMPRFTLP